MNATVALLFVAIVAAVAVAQDDVHAQIVEVTKSCAAAHKIAPEQLTELRSAADKSKIAASDDLKCFAKCAIEKTQLVKDGQLNLERLIAISKAHNKDEAKVRENVAKCQSKVTATNTCAEAWDLYVCVKQH